MPVQQQIGLGQLVKFAIVELTARSKDPIPRPQTAQHIFTINFHPTMVTNCTDFSIALACACLFSSIYWIPWFICWGFRILQSPPLHLFNVVIFLLLLFNIGEKAFEAYYFLTERPAHITELSYLVISAIRQVWSTAYLFPIVRGYLITYLPTNRDKTYRELRYALLVALFYTAVLVPINFLHSPLAQLWLSTLVQLLLITLQLYYAADTLEQQGSAMLQLHDQKKALVDNRLERLRAVMVVLLVQFMKLVYTVLVIIDIKGAYGTCGQVLTNFFYVFVDLAVNSLAIYQVWPRGACAEEEVNMLPLQD